MDAFGKVRGNGNRWTFAITIIAIVIIPKTRQTHLSYSYGGPTGPNHWCQIGYPKCCTRFQSPINIKTSELQRVNGHLHLLEKRTKISKAKIENDGHTVKLKFPSGKIVMKVKVGKLGDYLLDHIHFHVTSEHTVNGKKFPLEAHYVFRRYTYKSLEKATSDPNGVVVLAVLFKTTKDKNKKLENLIDNLKYVKNPHRSHLMKKAVDVWDWLPNLKKSSAYVSYEGSLTTPPCSRVTWFIWSKTVQIGSKQLKSFQSLRWIGTKSSINTRPIQKTLGRNVFFSEISKFG
ncbi:Carbonic AnHydrase [Chamberlinius hualienensis]